MVSGIASEKMLSNVSSCAPTRELATSANENLGPRVFVALAIGSFILGSSRRSACSSTFCSTCCSTCCSTFGTFLDVLPEIQFSISSRVFSSRPTNRKPASFPDLLRQTICPFAAISLAKPGSWIRISSASLPCALSRSTSATARPTPVPLILVTIPPFPLPSST